MSSGHYKFDIRCCLKVLLHSRCPLSLLPPYRTLFSAGNVFPRGSAPLAMEMRGLLQFSLRFLPLNAVFTIQLCLSPRLCAYLSIEHHSFPPFAPSHLSTSGRRVFMRALCPSAFLGLFAFSLKVRPGRAKNSQSLFLSRMKQHVPRFADFFSSQPHLLRYQMAAAAAPAMPLPRTARVSNAPVGPLV